MPPAYNSLMACVCAYVYNILCVCVCVSLAQIALLPLLLAVTARLILLDGGQCQDQGSNGGGGLRFPNLFGGLNNPFSLSNLFRQQRQNPNQQVPLPPPPPSPITFSSNPQFSLVGGQLSPVGGGGPNNFLQVPPLAFQQQLQPQPGQGQPFNAFNHNAQGKLFSFFSFLFKKEERKFGGI